MEESISDKLQSSIKDVKKNYSTKLARQIQFIIKTFDDKLYISTEPYHDFIIKITIESINQNVPDEIAYKSLFAKNKKKEKNLKHMKKIR